MLSADEALAICRVLAGLSGEEVILKRWGNVPEAVERLLFELEIARSDADRFLVQLQNWGIPAKRQTVRRLEKGGFEAGWDATE